MMQPESQAILRDFNRRLRAALREAPNHVRVEAALEVESHVLDVLSRSGSDEPEPDVVARVLSGFGSPEQYARAILSQRPGPEAVTVRSGLREVGLAVSDLLRGAWRLLWALAGRGAALLVLAACFVWRIGRGAVTASAGPARRIGRWLRINGAALAYGLRRLSRRLAAGAGATLRAVGRGALGAAVVARYAVRATTALIGWSGRLLRWALKAAGVAALALLAAASLGVAGFSVLAPDVTGWFVRGAQLSVAQWVEEVRHNTLGWMYFGTPEELAQSAAVVFGVTLALGLLLVGLLAYIGWNARRRRGATAGH
ncbi:MAG TPA: hypothetical protein VD969_00955 [Symbiobacteriaceae bacterium]|nr:hypothetical protein [Symbiobacteriaceae bacterium]